METRCNGTCFEIRDSKLGDYSPVLRLTRDDHTALLNTAREH